MKVKELIKILERCQSKDADVLVDGYEYGVCDLKSDGIQTVRYDRNVDNSYYGGPHKANEEGEFLGLLLVSSVPVR